jgi:hypothetical protein
MYPSTVPLSEPDKGGARCALYGKWRKILVATIIFLIIATGLLWADSHSNERGFIFIPGGDVGYGFLTHERQISYVEHAPWMSSPNLELLTFPLGRVMVLETSILMLLIVGGFAGKKATM